MAFLVGFITVLCIGNYFRAKRAQERQRQRREVKQAAAASIAPPNNNMGGGRNTGVEYEAPILPQSGGAPGRLL